ncbi:suppressor of fused domain protein [Nocardia panacis]|uniref:Suppressor of fused domain protein n=1 Tax=Nocardia panacis TaxID=2340916 RepID=A0A3A4KT30_9NOCA|nr:suppressor of fused domain protein [Nocardia panacis]RJO76656.1 suppressor of fused domain protein [Nocardia panacis]
MSEAPGWQAIDAALRPLYGQTRPAHWGTVQPYSLGGPDPLDGVSAYPRSEPVPHWHYIGYGLSELHEKEWDDPNISGWGFEFTFRLARRPEENDAPNWPAGFLQTLARYVIQSGKWFEPGHTIKANGPLDPERAESRIQAFAFTVDPELGAIDTPHGRLRFLQAVGLTMTEYRAALGGKAIDLLSTLESRIPLLCTNLDRDSLVSEPKPQASWPMWGGGLRGRG